MKPRAKNLITQSPSEVFEVIEGLTDYDKVLDGVYYDYE